MKKTLRILSVTAGIISAVSIVILLFIYLEDAITYFGKIKTKMASKKDAIEYID